MGERKKRGGGGQVERMQKSKLEFKGSEISKH